MKANVPATARPAARPMNLQQLDDRLVPATTATFVTDILTVTGDAAANQIVVAAAPDGSLTVTDGATPVAIRAAFGTPTVTSLRTVVVNAGGGDDGITLDRTLNVRDANGKLVAAPTANLRGGSGNDSINVFTGGFVGGVIGNAIVGNTVMEGGSGNDFLNSGFGNDLMLGGDGDDVMQWLPGTLNDVFEGGGGNDTAIIVGNDNNQGDAFVLGQGTSPGRALFQRTNLVPFTVDMGSVETVDMRTQSGDDTITVNNLANTGVRRVAANGGVGNDTITGLQQTARAVAMDLIGGDGNDTITGGAGDDVIDGGAGNDVLVGGDGRDVLVGGDGNDTLDGGRDGQIDVLIGGAGVDIFIRYQVGGVAGQFDELVTDMTQDEVGVMVIRA